MKIDIPNELHRELLEKLESASKKKDGFSKTCWGKLHALLKQYKVRRDADGPAGQSKRASAKARGRFK